jgi:hypothetical protein
MSGWVARGRSWSLWCSLSVPSAEGGADEVTPSGFALYDALRYAALQAIECLPTASWTRV